MSHLWRVVTNDGTNVTAVNDVTSETFSGTLVAFNALRKSYSIPPVLAPRFLNDVVPQTVVGPGVSAVLHHSVVITATTDCFVCITPTGVGVDGNAVSATNGHFIPSKTPISLGNIPLGSKLGVNTGTVYISAIV